MANKKLKSAVEAAEGQLKAGVEKVQSQLPAVRRRLEEAVTSVTRRKGSGQGPAPTPVMVPPAARGDLEPDDSWTVAELRAEARRRGLTGYSRKTKAELLADLRG